MAATFPYRHVRTGLVQDLTVEQAALFAGAYEREPEALTEDQITAQAQLEAALAEGSARTKAAQEAQAQLDAANEAAASAQPAPEEPQPIPAPTVETPAVTGVTTTVANTDPTPSTEA